MPRSWLDPRLEIRASRLHGRGTFATAAIGEGERVTIWEHRVLDSNRGAPPGELWPRTDGSFLWVPPNDRSAPEAFLNHSCDPNVWMADEVTLVARYPIAPAEELTIDYALFELDPAWVARWRCHCGTARCRGVITGQDSQRSELQERYRGHFHPMVLRRITT